MVAKPVPLPTIRACPGDGITGHSPHVFFHTSLTDTKAATAGPAKRKCHTTAIAIIGFEARPFFSVGGFGGWPFHDCRFKSLML